MPARGTGPGRRPLPARRAADVAGAGGGGGGVVDGGGRRRPAAKQQPEHGEEQRAALPDARRGAGRNAAATACLHRDVRVSAAAAEAAATHDGYDTHARTREHART